MRKILCTTALFSMLASPALAGDKELAAELEALKAQLQAQQALISKLESKLNANIAQQTEAIANLQPAAGSSANNVKISMKPSPKIESADGRFSFQPLGRIHLDYASFDDDKSDHPDGATFRRARIGFKGTVQEDWNYKFELDFGNKDSDDSVSFKDVYLAYTGLDFANVKVGNFKPAYGLEELTSSNYITFIERSLPTGSFATSEIIGAQLYNGGSNYSWALGVHNDKSTTKSSDDEAKSVVARVSYAPIAEKTKVVHLGLSGAYRKPDSSADSASFDTTAENSLQKLQSAETGTISGVDSVGLVGIEAAGVYGPFSLQGEYFHTSIDRDALADVDVNGWYTQASYFITGESRPYKASKGIFSRVKPKANFSLKDGTWGAWEVAARYSNLDLNDGVVMGGEIDDITLALNWYINPNTRLMFNYIIADTDSITPSGSNVAANDDPNVFLIRAQVDF